MFIAISCAIKPSQPTEREGYIAAERMRARVVRLVCVYKASCLEQPANLLINKQNAQVDSFIQKIHGEYMGKHCVSVVDKCQTFLPVAMATLFQHFPRTPMLQKYFSHFSSVFFSLFRMQLT